MRESTHTAVLKVCVDTHALRRLFGKGSPEPTDGSTQGQASGQQTAPHSRPVRPLAYILEVAKRRTFTQRVLCAPSQARYLPSDPSESTVLSSITGPSHRG